MSPTTQQEQNPFPSSLRASREFFERSTRVLEEADSQYRPTEAMMTVAQQVAHAGMTVDWFLEGATRPEGFDLDFEKIANTMNSFDSLQKARDLFNAAYERAIQFAESKTMAELRQPLPPGPVMGGQPILDIFGGIIDHTAHHRGALTVYSRLVGKVPIMPYGE